MKSFHLLLMLILILGLYLPLVSAGPVAVGVCYSACNAGYVSCLAGYGIVAGTTGPIGWWAWLTSAPAGCSAIQGTCMAACTALFAAPTP